jgi:hypothetical protein
MPSSLEGVCSIWLNVAKGVKIEGIALNARRTGSTEDRTKASQKEADKACQFNFVK